MGGAAWSDGSARRPSGGAFGGVLAPPNKRFKLTRLGWNWGGAWSAAILRGCIVIVGGSRRMLASQLKRGVVLTWGGGTGA